VEMAQYPQSWLHNTLEVWFGYVLTAFATIPAAAVGLFLISRGAGQQTAIFISVTLAVLGGFVAEWVIRLISRRRRLGNQPAYGEAFLVQSSRPTVKL
jgi:uncharacterized membrane protein